MYDPTNEAREFFASTRAEAISKACQFFGVDEEALAIYEPDPNAGGACHEYRFVAPDGTNLGEVRFQHGPIKVAGLNGPQHLDFLAVIVEPRGPES